MLTIITNRLKWSYTIPKRVECLALGTNLKSAVCCEVMKKYLITSAILLCIALAPISCQKSHHSADALQPAAIGFSAHSQDAMVKATSLSAFSKTFGVWGIARMNENNKLNLWNGAFTPVAYDDKALVYVPLATEYWSTGYAYKFIAVAPYTEEIAQTITTNDISGEESLSFFFDMGSKYAPEQQQDENELPVSPVYDFDLLASVAHTDPIASASGAGAQALTFWHMFTKIKVTVAFKDGGNTIEDAEVSQVRLAGVNTEASYDIAFDDQNKLAVECTSSAPETIAFNAATKTIHVIPQEIAGFRLYLDFVINGIRYKDFKVDLNVYDEANNPSGTNPAVYRYNESYNWNITIGPKAAVSFTVTVTPWEDAPVSDGNDDDDDNYIDVI